MQAPEHFGISTTAGEEQRVLYAERVTQLYSNALVGLLATVINSLVLVVIQRDVTSRAVLIAWVVLLTLISLLRYSDIRAFRRRSPDASEANRWGRRFIVGLAFRVWHGVPRLFSFFQLDHSHTRPSLLLLLAAWWLGPPPHSPV